MIVQLECLYCGKIWEFVPRNESEIEDLSCSICGDKKLKVKDKMKSSVDYYQGSPPFPVKSNKGWNY